MGEFERFFSRLLRGKLGLALGVISVLGLLATALLVPFALSRMPVDYFVRDVSPARTSLFVRVLKNVFGIVLILLGVAMLVLPGQGLLTIVLGLGLVDFPGRRRLERRLVGRPGVLKTINMLRHRLHREPLESPPRA